MARTCRECNGEIKIAGIGSYGDSIEVECQNPDCLECYEVEMDGFGEGGLEMADALLIQMEKDSI